MKRRNKMGMMKEFRDFAVRGNVVDMAVGVVIGGAFGKDHIFPGGKYHHAAHRNDDGRC